ncbi:MAG: sigma-70 family RNA polymerase sigma factor [Spirochaetes bacterium]|nr:sigma-70 family RNA polymerase sigma factor [Spirochaetota bacterium]
MSKKEKFTEIHNEYYPLVFSTARTKVDNIEDARDICQEVFINFYEKPEAIENPGKWLYETLRFAVLNYYKSRRQDIDVNIDDIFPEIGLTFVNGFRNARIIMNEAFENNENFMDETDRNLFDLIAFYNYSYAETGKELGLTGKRVEYKYKRIVDKIIDFLKKRGINNLEDLL